MSLVNSYACWLVAALCFWCGSHVVTAAAAASFSPYDALWQRAAQTIASAENESASDWYAGGGDFPWAWRNANGEFNSGTYDFLNRLIAKPGQYALQSESRELATNFWVSTLADIEYELSLDDTDGVQVMNTRGMVLLTELVVEYERVMGEIGATALSHAVSELAARNVTIYGKTDYVVTYTLDYVWSCRSRDLHRAPRQYSVFKTEFLQFVRAETGRHANQNPTSLPDIDRVLPSPHMKRAFVAKYPCMPAVAAASLTGKFLQAVATSMLVLDAAIRVSEYPLTANAFVRNAKARLQSPKTEDGGLSASRVRDVNGRVRFLPAFRVHRSVSDIFNDMTASARSSTGGSASPVRQVRVRTASVSIGDTVVASVRMALRRDDAGVEVEGDVRLPQQVRNMSLLTPNQAATLQNRHNSSTSTPTDPNYYEECTEVELVAGYSLVSVGPATLQLARVNGSYQFVGDGWFNAAPVASAVALAQEDKDHPVLNRKTSGYHWALNELDMYDFGIGGDAGIAGAYLITTSRAFSGQCHSRMFNDTQAAALRAAMQRAGDDDFDGWTSGSGGGGAAASKGTGTATWDDGSAPLQFTLADIKASLAAATTDPVVAAALRGAGDDMSEGSSINGDPPRAIISTPLEEQVALVMATRVVWPGVDADAFQTATAAVTGTPADADPEDDKTRTDKGADDNRDGGRYSMITIVVACAIAVAVGLGVGVGITRRVCGRQDSTRNEVLLMN
jgi:hypothetical protein